MKRINIIKTILFTSTIVFGVSCTNLEEEVLDGVSGSGGGGAVNSAAVLRGAYEGLRGFQDQDKMFALEEMSSDALVGPTRGGDWDDAAKWRQLHVHSWASDHVEITGAWNSLLSNVYRCNIVVENGSAAEKAEARFLRAFYYYNIIDLFGQAPYRDAGSALTDDPKVWTRSEATTFVIEELKAILSSLPARTAGDASRANQDAAHFLLAKMYLNKAVFTAAAPAGPYTFDKLDMDEVISHVDEMTNTLAPDYWSNFAPTNNLSDELVFTAKNTLGGDGGNIQSRWRMGMHYNQTPSGWNGFTTVADFYDKFDANDRRAHHSTPQIISEFGNPIGFQEGQMKNGKNRDKKGSDKDANNQPYTNIPGGSINLEDRNGNPLIYTKAITMITSGATLETAGVRAMKYEPDARNIEKPENDYVFMRYSDALLMKAEALQRGGSLGTKPLDMADYWLRTGQPAITLDLDVIYEERGKELWWEGWRRNDMIRFEKFLKERDLKPYVSDNKYVLYPIPADALFNANLKQNPGY